MIALLSQPLRCDKRRNHFCQSKLALLGRPWYAYGGNVCIPSQARSDVQQAIALDSPMVMDLRFGQLPSFNSVLRVATMDTWSYRLPSTQYMQTDNAGDTGQTRSHSLATMTSFVHEFHDVAAYLLLSMLAPLTRLHAPTARHDAEVSEVLKNQEE